MDPTVEQAFDNNSDKSILVQVHSSSSGDIFYNNHMGGRMNFYSGFNRFFGYPTLLVDGLKEPTFPYTIFRVTNEIDNRRAIETPVSIEPELSQSLAKTGNINSTVNYKTTITSEEVFGSKSLRLLMFIVETNIEYSAPNGTQNHKHVALDIVPDENGIIVDLTNENNLSHVIEGSFEYNLTENHSIVSIVQDFNTGEIYQAIKTTYDQYFLDTVENEITNPSNFSISNVFPNPFNPTTNISFTVGNESPLSIQVSNIIGKQIDNIIDNKSYSPGNYTVQWNASEYPSGTYFIKLITTEGIEIKKTILMK